MDLKEKIKKVFIDNTETWFGRILKEAPLKKYYKLDEKNLDKIAIAVIKLCEGSTVTTSENSLHKHDVSNRRELLIDFLYKLNDNEEVYIPYGRYETAIDQYEKGTL